MSLFVPPVVRATDANNLVLPGAKWQFYLSGTTTPAPVYTSSALSTPHPNPVVADAGGLFSPIYLDPAITYRSVLKDALGSTIQDVDDVTSSIAPSALSATDGSARIGFQPVGSGAVAETVQKALQRIVFADQFGATFDGVTDDTANLQKAFTAARVAGGGVIHFPMNKTVIVSQSILVGSNTTVHLNGCTVKAKQSGFAGTNAGKNCFLFRNYNYTASALTDTNIEIAGPGKFDYGTVTISGGGAHSVAMRYVDNVTVRDVYGTKGENVTAFLACRDTLVENCEGYNVSNCYFDHWDGAGTAKVVNCVGRNDSGVDIAQGIQFTGTGSVLEDRTSINCMVTGNYLEGVKNSVSNYASAIISNANDAGSAAYRFKSIGNTVKDCNNGIVFAGAGGHHLSLGDTLINVLKSPIMLQTTDSATPADCRVLFPHLIDCNHGGSTLALVTMAGVKNDLRGLKVTNTGAAAYTTLVTFASGASGCKAEITGCPSGSGARATDTGTGTILIDSEEAPTTTGAAGFSVTPGMEAIFFNGSGCTLTLPPATNYKNRIIELMTLTAAGVISASSNVTPLGSATPGTAILAATAGKFARLRSDGTNWRIVAAN